MSLTVSTWQCQLYSPCWNYIHCVHLCLQLCLLDSVNSTARAGTTSTVYIYVSNCVYLTVSTLQPVLELHPLCTFTSPTVSIWQCQLYNPCWNYIHCVHLCLQLCLFDSVNSTARAGTRPVWTQSLAISVTVVRLATEAVLRMPSPSTRPAASMCSVERLTAPSSYRRVGTLTSVLSTTVDVTSMLSVITQWSV